jgi:hypothetical protein
MDISINRYALTIKRISTRHWRQSRTRLIAEVHRRFAFRRSDFDRHQINVVRSSAEYLLFIKLRYRRIHFLLSVALIRVDAVRRELLR